MVQQIARQIIRSIQQGSDLPGITTTEEIHVRSHTGRTVIVLEDKEMVISWLKRARRSETLRFVRITRIEEEVQINI